MASNVIFYSSPLSPYSFPARDNEYLLDEAENAGFNNLPYSCRAGACTTCCSKLLQGVVHIPANTIYDDDQINRGFFPMCVAYASSDVSMLINQEQYLY